MKRSVHLCALGLTLVCALTLPASGEECVVLKTPELVDIIEGDRQVELWWRDAHPESLTCVRKPKLGTVQSPWRGNAGMTSAGFYTGACDFDYKFTVVVSDVVQFRWTEVNWVTGARPRRVITVVDTDVAYELSDGMTVTVSSSGLFTITDSEDWTPEDPSFHGIYTGGADSTADVPVAFTFVCVTGGELSESGGSGVVVDWSDDAGGSGSIDVGTAGADYEVDKGLLVNFPAGSYVAGDTLVMDAYRPLVLITDSEDWTPEDPSFHGIYTGGADSTADVPVVFTFACTAGGDLNGSGGVVVDWSDDAGGSGSIDVGTAGADYEVDKGLLVNFPAGSYVAGDTLVMDALRPFVLNDQFSIKVETFDGYQVLRRSVEDRPNVYKVVANISRCDTAAFFLPVDGTRYFIDVGIRGDQEGVTPDPNAPTVLNGFPYYYAVVTYDVLSDPSAPGKLVRSPIDDTEVYPTPPVGNSVDNVYVVPNPYLFRAGWEEMTAGGTGAKLQFLNVPQGAQISIFDVTGNYVQTVTPEMMHDGESQSGRAEWNLKNASGRDVVSGVYIYYVTAAGSEKVGRFVIVR